MSNENQNLTQFNCFVCGILFGIDKNVAKNWQESHNKFLCPNGHTLSWNGKTAEEKEKELKNLRNKVKSLEEKLVTSNTNLDIQSKLVVELQSELEIWRPNERK